MADIHELELDLAEIQKLLSQATRKSVLTLLNNKKSEIDAQLKLKTTGPQKIENPPKVEKTQKQEEQKQQEEEDTFQYTAITKYSWEQEGKKVKIFLLLDDIGQIPKENVIVKFFNSAFDIKIRGYKGQNMRLSMKRTCNEISKDECTFSHKKNSIIITMIKKENKQWEQLAYKEPPIKQDKVKEDTTDPQASLMNMMKDMYNSGDDDMKRTIAQAWSKAQTEKSGDPMGGMGGMPGMGGMGGMPGMGGMGMPGMGGMGGMPGMPGMGGMGMPGMGGMGMPGMGGMGMPGMGGMGMPGMGGFGKDQFDQ